MAIREDGKQPPREQVEWEPSMTPTFTWAIEPLNQSPGTSLPLAAAWK